jgi:hypothetical protein
MLKMADKNRNNSLQRVLVFQERGSGEKKIAGIEAYLLCTRNVRELFVRDFRAGRRDVYAAESGA